MTTEQTTLIINSSVTVAMAIIGLIGAIVVYKGKVKADENALALASLKLHLGKQDEAIADVHQIVTKIENKIPPIPGAVMSAKGLRNK